MHYSTVYLSNESQLLKVCPIGNGVGRVISLHCHPRGEAIPEDSGENFFGLAKGSVENRGKTR